MVSNRMRNSPKAVPISALEDVCIGDFIGEKGWLGSLFWAGMSPTAQLHYVHESGHTFQKNDSLGAMLPFHFGDLHFSNC